MRVESRERGHARVSEQRLATDSQFAHLTPAVSPDSHFACKRRVSRGRGGRSAPAGRMIVAACALLACFSFTPNASAQSTLARPTDVRAFDHPGDGGLAIDVEFERSADDRADAASPAVKEYVVSRSAERNGLYAEVARVNAADEPRDRPIRVSTD